MTHHKLAIFGTSGFAREVLDIGLSVGFTDFVFLGTGDHEKRYRDYDILPESPKRVAELVKDGWVFAVGAGAPDIRRKISENNPDCTFTNLIHPTTTFGLQQEESLLPDTGLIIGAGCRITNSIRFGAHVLLNLNVTVGHDALLGDFVSIMPGVNVSGNVDLEPDVYIGTGATIINGSNQNFLTVGRGSVIGAGAVVARDIPPGVTAVGIPAKPLPKRG